MLRAFWLVLLDLWEFVFPSEKKVDDTSRKELPAPTKTTDYLPPRPVATAIVAPAAVPVLAETNFAAAPVVESFDKPQSLAEAAIMYVAMVGGARLLSEPRLEYDGVLAVIPYGQSVTVRAFLGAYAKVATLSGEGYIHKDSLTPKQAEVWPQFKTGVVYDNNAEATILTRLLLGDEFLAGALALPLQASEYILLRLLRDRQTITWPPKRPRQIGSWHKLLRGLPQIKISVTPVVDTIMEWVAEDGIGRLAYVEAVFGDDTLRVSGVGIVVAGEYSELSFKPEVWHEWRPVFISVVA